MLQVGELTLAFALSALVGAEREIRQNEAGYLLEPKLLFNQEQVNWLVDERPLVLLLLDPEAAEIIGGGPSGRAGFAVAGTPCSFL